MPDSWTSSIGELQSQDISITFSIIWFRKPDNAVSSPVFPPFTLIIIDLGRGTTGETVAHLPMHCDKFHHQLRARLFSIFLLNYFSRSSPDFLPRLYIPYCLSYPAFHDRVRMSKWLCLVLKSPPPSPPPLFCFCFLISGIVYPLMRLRVIIPVSRGF